MIFRLLLAFILNAMLYAPSQANDSRRVVTSIRPLQLIANEIMAGAGQAQVLIGQNESPHHFQLKPSQLETVSQSHLLIWISNDFETALGKLQHHLPTGSHRLQLIRSIAQSNLIGEHGDIDGHIWLSAQNVALISQLISEKLSILDPPNQSLYRANTARLIKDLNTWKQQAHSRLQGLKPRYILDHQFLRYFEHSFGLLQANSLRSNHDHGSAIRQLSELQSQLQQQPVACMLVSSQTLSRQARQFSQRYRLKVKVIQTLNENNRYHSIIDLLDSIVTSLEDCI